MSPQKLPPDHADRQAAIHARGVNVIADAGAGTGKTTLLVARLVEMVAPADDAHEPVSLGRIAAITFTRKAAGELKLRIREALLRELSNHHLSAVRRGRLADALALLDTAHVGTIHSFSDRLLRLRPVEARLSPSYEIVEDETALLDEAFAVFLQAIERGALADDLAGTSGEACADLTEATIVDALRAGMRVESREHEHGEFPGLDRLFQRLVATRDAPPVVPLPRRPDVARFDELVEELAGFLRGSAGEGDGTRFFLRTLARLRGLKGEADPTVILKELLRIPRTMPAKMRKSIEFLGDAAGWKAWKAFDGDDGKNPVRAKPLFDDLLRPYARWMARRLVATAPAVIATYEKVKARHRAVDQVDLLLRLRDLLRDRLDVRAEYQALFDHVFVDEFQDTDPLQAEIVLYLCEEEARAKTWRDVRPSAGKLTIVGDPKQSIYRFRRADIAVYAEVRAIVARGPHLVAKLSANFRSEPRLIGWLNHRFDEVLGTAVDGSPAFDPDQGTVVNEHLTPGREGSQALSVAVLPLASESDKKGAFRAVEVKALTAWLRWLVEGKKRDIVDPATGERRPARYGDVAILAMSTTQLPPLFPELDRLGIPYAARGGQMFLKDPLHRQFLLALRGIADGDDGVAQAALFRAPFFALDYDDLARERAAEEGSTHEGVVRARAAKAIVQDLRRRRLERTPGQTARDLLERTAFGRSIALGPNGAQRLDALRELCLALDTIAAAEALDFDGATARLRDWIDHPAQLDPPRPVGSDAVQILTAHQAKGLEFPIVVLWDSCADVPAYDRGSPYLVSADGTSWALSLEGVEWCEPDDDDLAGRELRYLHAERRRLIYVAATRARDLLVLPVAGDPNPKWISGCLAGGAPAEWMETFDPYVVGAEPAWAKEMPEPVAPSRGDGSRLAAEVSRAWGSASVAAAAPRFAPAAVSGEAHRVIEERDEEAGRPRPERKSRFGPVFGETVHRAIGIALAEPALSPAAAVARAAAATRLSEMRSEAAEDVGRALAALADAGLRRAPGPDLQLEYPVAFASGGKLLSGYVDLLAAEDGVVTVIDFKTDAPPKGDVHATHPAYVEQVRSYARILVDLGIAREAKGGLLFTAEAAIRWL